MLDKDTAAILGRGKISESLHAGVGRLCRVLYLLTSSSMTHRSIDGSFAIRASAVCLDGIRDASCGGIME